MANIAFDLEVFQRVAASSPVPGDPRIAQLGSIGPDLYDYVPISSRLSDALHDAFLKGIDGKQITDTLSFDLTPITGDSALALELFQRPTMVAYSILFRELVVDYWPRLQRSRDTLAALQAAVDAQDTAALAELEGAFGQMETDGAALGPMGLALKGVSAMIFRIAAIPPAIQVTSAQARPWLPQTNRPFEFLRWHNTDRYALALQSLADSENNRAYAFGYLCHCAASVTGRPLVNNINGGPYRSHWWRNRLVSNYIDSWTFGRYETPATLSGDTPSVPYAAWKNICKSNLQERFNVANINAPADSLAEVVSAVALGQLGGFPAQFPDELASYMQAAIDTAHPTVGSRPPGYSTDLVKQSFTGLFAVTWFMTSGYGPLGWSASDLGAPPSACPEEPSWVSGGGPPPSAQSGPSIGDILAGIVFAIAGLITLLFGFIDDGIAHLKNALGHFQAQPDWEQASCNLYWLRKIVLDAGLGAADVCTRLGLAFPAPEKLGTIDANGFTHPAVDGPANSVPLTKTNRGLVGTGGGSYPHQMDESLGFADLNFALFPFTNAETPPTMNFPVSDAYPDVVVDQSGFQNGGMRNGNVFPSANLFFGDAVSNALDLIASGAAGLPSYNLDADRGYGWKTWTPQPNTFPGSGQINNPIPEP